MSNKLVQSEEDKLKISRDLVDSQIEANKLREKYEEEIFELKNKGTQNELREELEKIRRSYEEQQRRLEEKIVALGKDQQENRRAIRNTQQELAQQSAALISSQFQLKEVEAENSKLQNHLKELNQEYRARLTHYIHDVTECVRGGGEGDVGARLKEYVDSMLREVRGSYRSREEQLTSTVRSYRKRLQKLSNTQQLLLIAYRMQREQILARADHGLEAGPPEATFGPGESEIRGETERELQRLREDKQRLEKELRAAQEQVSTLSQPSQRLSEEAWTDIRNQLRDAVNTTQEAQERERLQLISRAALAEQQVCELQEYVDNHLGRYKLEVTRLRRMLGLEGGRSQSAELPKPRPLHRSLRNSSNEA